MSTPDRLSHDDLREGDLLAFLDGEAPPALAAHIAGCPRCQRELAELRRAEALLAAAFVRAACPEPELLLRLQAGLLPPDEAGSIAAHAAGCAACTAELALLASPPSPSVPERLAQAGLRLVRALLQPAAPPALALRGAAPRARQAVFAAEGYQILVVVAPARPPAGPYQIEGQLLTPAGPQPATAVLAGGAQPEREAEVDAVGFFAFDAVAPGSYTLTITTDAAQVLAEILEVP